MKAGACLSMGSAPFCCVALGKMLSLSGPLLPHLQYGTVKPPAAPGGGEDAVT